MLTEGDNREIHDVVVIVVAIYVMDDLPATKWATDELGDE